MQEYLIPKSHRKVSSSECFLYLVKVKKFSLSFLFTQVHYAEKEDPSYLELAPINYWKQAG